MDQMVNDKKWCTEISKVNDSYSCDADPRANLRAHHNEYTLHYNKVKELSASAKNNLNVVNLDTIDFDGTLTDDYLFSDKSVTTYTYFPYYGIDSMFYHMCLGSVRGGVKSIIESPAMTKTDIAGLSRDSVSPYSYLIELTSDASIISQFKKMAILGGSTDSNSGLLRSLPVIAKGNNPKKVIIMVTDGEDSSAPKELATALHQEHHICKKIKEGLLNHNKIHKTVAVDIFFISLDKNGVDGKNVKFWRESCVGDDNAFVVSDYHSLVNILAKISKKERINFIDKSGF